MTTEATLTEAHREGVRRAMEIYQSAGALFDEQELQTAYLAGIAGELRRLLKREKE